MRKADDCACMPPTPRSLTVRDSDTVGIRTVTQRMSRVEGIA